ncbi:MAG: hypothetical protein MR945_05830 [Agathobacter sp.]|nr:hypothetical protein [Agathobacter sp.]
MQFIICQDDFLEQLKQWLLTLDDERMILLRQFIFEVELSETEQLKEILYKYGSYLTEKNFFGRKFFEQMTELLRHMELNRGAAIQP